MYDLVLTREAQKSYGRADSSLTRRLNRCFDLLRNNPRSHPNIKRLHGTLSGYFRYRVGDWRVIYEVNEETRRITVLLIVHRSQAYE